ncbi:MAG: CaiB/BaiF CoA transferase family protein [Gammaproteobacteria bacterium]
MYDLMAGVRVIEVAEHTFVPSSAMILADWGADVIKVERAQGGDPGRHLVLPGTGGKVNPFFETPNRGKRGIALDLNQDAGRQILYRLIEKADVFITNLRTSARRKLKIEPEDLLRINPKLIYARGSGYGQKGADADRGGFDYPSSWCRSGSGFVQTLPDGEPPMQPGSVGDLCGGATLAGAISAALFRRERTGKGAVVDHALYMIGTYIMGQSLVAASAGLPHMQNRLQRDSASATTNNYRTRDGRWLNLCMLVPGWWPDFCRHVERPDLIDDPRFAAPEARMKNARDLIGILNEVFASRTLDEWRAKLKTMEAVWEPMASPAEVLKDPQAIENGFVVPVTMADGTVYTAAASPCLFDGQKLDGCKAAPAFGQHTLEVLREIGIGDGEIAALKAAGTVVQA